MQVLSTQKDDCGPLATKQLHERSDNAVTGFKCQPETLRTRRQRVVLYRLLSLIASAILIYKVVANQYISCIVLYIQETDCRWTGARLSCQPAAWLDAQSASNTGQSSLGHPAAVPDYVLRHAPFVYLSEDEKFWPGDMNEHMRHTEPRLNYLPISGEHLSINTSNLGELNKYGSGRNVYLTSNDDVEDRPEWLRGEHNIPRRQPSSTSTKAHPWHSQSAFSRVNRAKLRKGGRSSAPAVLVLVPKEHGVLDAFWFFFYSYNLGNIVLNIRWGNHVGDWEHTLVRFQHGKPKAVFVSEHNFGGAYSYGAVEKLHHRPVVYSAVGTHAMYATPGPHPYILPLGLLHDETSRGPLWDPALNLLAYHYDLAQDHLVPATTSSSSGEANSTYYPTSWFHFAGHWGDKIYPLEDKRQYGLAGEYHYVDGPTGPKFKHLSRRKICQGPFEQECVIRHWLGQDWDVRSK